MLRYEMKEILKSKVKQASKRAFYFIDGQVSRSAPIERLSNTNEALYVLGT